MRQTKLKLERARQRGEQLRSADITLRLARLGITSVARARISTPTVGVIERPQRLRRSFQTKITIK